LLSIYSATSAGIFSHSVVIGFHFQTVSKNLSIDSLFVQSGHFSHFGTTIIFSSFTKCFHVLGSIKLQAGLHFLSANKATSIHFLVAVDNAN
jgi:hypothetical protein